MRSMNKKAFTDMVSSRGAKPEHRGPLPDNVRGLVLAVKAYEREAIDAARTGSLADARRALLLYPAVGEWEPSEKLLEALIKADQEHLQNLRSPVSLS
jgi:alpha-galactosidase/6-phospho-beta-glucosidase family protein